MLYKHHQSLCHLHERPQDRMRRPKLVNGSECGGEPAVCGVGCVQSAPACAAVAGLQGPKEPRVRDAVSLNSQVVMPQ